MTDVNEKHHQVYFLFQIDKSMEQPSERDTFAAWLGSVVHQVSDQQFRSFQTEVFGISMRYLKPASTDTPKAAELIPTGRQGFQLQQLCFQLNTPAPSSQQFDSQAWYPQQLQTLIPVQHHLQQHPALPQTFIAQPCRQVSAGTSPNIISQAYSAINQDDITTNLNFSEFFTGNRESQASKNASVQGEENHSTPSITESTGSVNVDQDSGSDK